MCLNIFFTFAVIMENIARKSLRVLITSPSLNEDENVSGISTLVRQIIKNGDCEFVHFIAGRKDTEKAGFLWILKQFFLPLRLLRQVYTKKIDVVHINTALVPLSIYRDFVLTLAAKFAGTGILLHPNGGRFLMENAENWTLNKILSEMLHTADKVLVLSSHEKQSLLRRWKNLNIDVLPNAIAVNEAIERKEENEVRRIIFLGRIHESKGLDEIIESCRVLKQDGFEFRFDCYGTGPKKDYFLEEMRKVLGDWFQYGGIISGKDKWKALAKSDIFFLPSRYGEGLPLAMLEAMTAKCVPVVADVASVRAVINDGSNGFMVKPYDVEEVVEKLKLLLSNEIDWKILRNNARKTIEEKFSIEDYVVELKKIYEEVNT